MLYIRIIVFTLLVTIPTGIVIIYGNSVDLEKRIVFQQKNLLKEKRNLLKREIDAARQKLKTALIEIQHDADLSTMLIPIVNLANQKELNEKQERRLQLANEKMQTQLSTYANRGFSITLLLETGEVAYRTENSPYDVGTDISYSLFFKHLLKGYMRDSIETVPYPHILFGSPLNVGNGRRIAYIIFSIGFDDILSNVLGTNRQVNQNLHWAALVNDHLLTSSIELNAKQIPRRPKIIEPFSLLAKPAKAHIPLSSKEFTWQPLLLKNPTMCGLVAIEHPVQANAQNFSLLLITDTTSDYTILLSGQLWSMTGLILAALLLLIGVAFQTILLNRSLERIGDYLSMVYKGSRPQRELPTASLGSQFKRVTFLVNKVSEQALSRGGGHSIPTAPSIEDVLAAQSINEEPVVIEDVEKPQFATPTTDTHEIPKELFGSQEESNIDPELLASLDLTAGMDDGLSMAEEMPDPLAAFDNLEETLGQSLTEETNEEEATIEPESDLEPFPESEQEFEPEPEPDQGLELEDEEPPPPPGPDPFSEDFDDEISNDPDEMIEDDSISEDELDLPPLPPATQSTASTDTTINDESVSAEASLDLADFQNITPELSEKAIDETSEEVQTDASSLAGLSPDLADALKLAEEAASAVPSASSVTPPPAPPSTPVPDFPEENESPEDDIADTIEKIPGPASLEEIPALDEDIEDQNNIQESEPYRALYDEFIAAREQTGENTKDLSYEKFLQKVTKTKETILSKQNCKDVTFHVNIKENKAALKATPVK